MPDANGYYTSEEKSAYRSDRCGVCGSEKQVKWYPRESLADMTNSDYLWSPASEMCPTPDKH